MPSKRSIFRCPTGARMCLVDPADRRTDRMLPVHLLSQSRRPRRCGEWTSAKAVTFIVTLAACRSVTLAARAAGMSRKSAYVLKARDHAFATAWAAAVSAGKHRSVQGSPISLSKGDKVNEVEGPPNSSTRVHASPSRVDRERAFEQMLAGLRESPPLAPRPPAQ